MDVAVQNTPEWAAGFDDPASTPASGDVWELSWNGLHEGIVVVAVVRDDYVLGMPVTAGPAGPANVVVPLAGSSITVWPRLETGLGRFLLHRRLGTVLSDDRIRELRLWAHGRGDLATFAPGDGEEDSSTVDHLVRDFQRRCFIEWPSAEESTLDIAATEMTPRQFQEHTGWEPGRILELWSGLILTPEERQALGENADAWTTEVVDLPTRELTSPEVKGLVLELCATRGISEREARNAARDAYALAARTDSVTARRASRAADAIRTLIADSSAS
ncbi:hypothetical protein ACIPVB_02375 [Microbacterium sp. NPDC090007]|uniref:hypothetical protein n=1 Tax=Microbacterium sp. NPDC090007 TaxID=3364204 RepID=UPI0038195038